MGKRKPRTSWGEVAAATCRNKRARKAAVNAEAPSGTSAKLSHQAKRNQRGRNNLAKRYSPENSTLV